MKKIDLALLLATIPIAAVAPAQRLLAPEPTPAFSLASLPAGTANLPFQPIGASDLIHLSVANAPELTQTFRVDREGNLHLPLLQLPLPAAGLLPDALGAEIATALRKENLLVRPVVEVAVVEYRSRDVTISGAVKSPTTIEELGNLRVLAALSLAGGLLPEAGPEIIIEQAGGALTRLSVRDLYDGLHPQFNVPVYAGAQIRVPACERVFVVGDVKRPGAFPFLALEDTTVLQLLALSGGLDSFSQRQAWIYRVVPGMPGKQVIAVPLRSILKRKSADVKLAANDILYIPVNDGLKTSATVLNHMTGMGNAAASAAIWSSH